VMPRPIMQHILKKFRFVPSLEYFPDQYEDKVEVWYRPDAGSAHGTTYCHAVTAGD
jgi:hypothetical protein